MKSFQTIKHGFKNNKNPIKLTIGILIGVLFLYLSFRNINFREMVHILSAANYWYILLSVIVILVSHYLRAIRWHLFLFPIEKIKTQSLFSALSIGYAANSFLPGHLGDLLRAYIIGEKHAIYTSTTLATIVLERIIDIFSLLALMIFVIYIFEFPFWVIQCGITLLVLSIVLVSLLIGSKLYKTNITQIFKYLLRPFPNKLSEKVNSFLFNFLDGIVPLASIWHYLYSALLSASIWICYGFVYYCCLKAFGLEQNYDLDWYVGLVILVITTIALLVPSSPGYVGTYHYLCQVSLTMFGVSATEAISYATIAHAVNILPITVIGLMMANIEGIALYRKTIVTG